jgi:hypothetical protein
MFQPRHLRGQSHHQPGSPAACTSGRSAQRPIPGKRNGLASALCILALPFVFPSQAKAFGADELALCNDITTALSISTYTDRLNDYLTTKTGVAPAWLASKSAKVVMGKNKVIGGIDGATAELKDFCEIASTGDDLLRTTKLLAKIAGKTGPIGSYVEAQMGAGLVALQEGSKLVSTENTLGQSSRSQVYFNIRYYVPRWYWADKVMDRAEVLNTVRAVQVYSRNSGGPVSAQGVLSSLDDCAGKKAACFVANFDYPDDAGAAYAIRVDMSNGQSIFTSIKQLQIVSGEPVKTLGVTASLGKNGATLFVPR